MAGKPIKWALWMRVALDVEWYFCFKVELIKVWKEPFFFSF
jgi:hypothetical protein